MDINYDFVIIGSGISGLYSAYKIKKEYPDKSFIVLEKYKKQWIGGRTSNADFYGTQIVTAAGIGREDTNPLLINLLKEIKIPYQKTISIIEYSKTIDNPVDIIKIMNILKKEYNKNKNNVSSLTFKQFSEKILGNKLYNDFIVSSGYTDYENADIYETLYNYGMDDNKGGWIKLYIPWKKLILKLASIIGFDNIKFSQNVINIEKINNVPSSLFQVDCENGNNFFCNKIILATTITSLHKLFPNYSVYKQIHGQPFLIMYGKFTKSSNEILKNIIKHYTIVPGPLQKIIPINLEKGVYMIAYSDNASALYLKKYLENTPENRDFFCKLIEKSLGLNINSLHLIAIKDYYWPVGTHYYAPLHGNFKNRNEFVYKAQHPTKNIFVVGEVVSRYQGWVEGALESVETLFSDIDI